MSSENSYLHSLAVAAQTGAYGAQLWSTDSSGQIWSCYQTSPGGGWTDWDGPGFAGQYMPAWQLAAADQNTGCLMLFALNIDGGVSAVAQASPSGGWDEWSADWLAGQPTEMIQIAAAQQWGSRGIELWSIDHTGNIWTLYQKTAGGAWSSWEGPGFKNQPVPMTRVAAAGQNNGCVMLVALDAAGQVWSISQTSPGGNWGGWSGPNLAGQPCPFHTVTAAQQGGSRGIEIWATDIDGNIWTLYQLTAGGSWSSWEGPGFKGQSVAMSRTAASGQGNGNVVLFSLQEGTGLWSIYQQWPGGDWGAWAEVETPPISETTSWTEIGLDFATIFGGGTHLYGTDDANALYMYSGADTDWTAMGGPAAFAYAATNDVVYAITADQTEVMAQDPETLAWSSIGGSSSFGSTLGRIFTSYSSLYVVSANGTVWKYMDTPNNWFSVGGPFAMVTANDTYCFAIASDGQSVVMAPSGTQDWTTIGGAMTSLIAAENNVYGVDAAGAVHIYKGNAASWPQIGNGFAQLLAWETSLYGLTSDKTSIQIYVPASKSWVPIAGAANSFGVGWGYVAGLSAGTVSLSLFKGSPVTSQATEEDIEASRRLTEVSEPTNDFNWIFTFKVADDQNLLGYWDHIAMGISSTHNRPVRITNWRRGKSYTLAYRLQVNELSSLALWGFDSPYTLTQLKLESVSAYNAKTGTTYLYTVNAYVPKKPTSPELVVSNPTVTPGAPSGGPTKVFIWDNRSTSLNFGHAGLLLSDETYITYWADGSPKFRLGSSFKAVKGSPDRDSVKWPDPCATPRFADSINEPRIVIAFSNLNEDAMRQWWDSFWDSSPTYRPASQNCSTVVYQALVAGGILNNLPDYVLDDIEGTPVWTPMNLMRLCAIVQQYAV